MHPFFNPLPLNIRNISLVALSIQFAVIALCFNLKKLFLSHFVRKLSDLVERLN